MNVSGTICGAVFAKNWDARSSGPRSDFLYDLFFGGKDVASVDVKRFDACQSEEELCQAAMEMKKDGV
jgi:hypothetical protein